MTFTNRTGAEFTPFGDMAASRLGLGGYEDPADLRGGLYYRSQVFPGLRAAVEACIDGTEPFEQLSVDAYQAWNETGWKRPHGSLAAAERFGQKGREERRELADALEEFREGRGTAHAVSELGDVLWVATAFANNSAAVVSDGMRQRLFEYVMGTRMYRGRTVGYPRWYDRAGQLAVQQQPISVGDLDGLITAGFVPRFSPVMNVHEEDDQLCTEEYVFDLAAYTALMGNISERQHAVGDAGYVFSAAFMQDARDVGKVAAEVYFRVAGMAHVVGSTLAEVAATNVRKVDGRIANGTVDKSDGGRHGEA